MHSQDNILGEKNPVIVSMEMMHIIKSKKTGCKICVGGFFCFILVWFGGWVVFFYTEVTILLCGCLLEMFTVSLVTTRSSDP